MYFSKPAITIFVALAVTIPIFGVEGARTRKLKSSKSSKSSTPVATLTSEIPFTVLEEASIDATEMSSTSILGQRQIFNARDDFFGNFMLESSCEVTGLASNQCTISLCATRAFFGGCVIYQYAGLRPEDQIGVAVQSSATGGFFGSNTFVTIRYEDDQNLVVSLYNAEPETSLEETFELITTIPGFCPPEASPGTMFPGKKCTDFTVDEIFNPPGARRALGPENYDHVLELVKKLHSK